VDGKGIGDVGNIVLKDRKHLSQDGMVIVIIAINQTTGEFIYGPDIVTRGFVFEDESQEFLDETRKIVLDTLAGVNLEVLADLNEVKLEVRRVLRKFFNKTIERRPVILPLILEM
jgi:ribonuclease J